jgi:hypothetical protein
MNAEQIANRAAELIGGDRAKVHGNRHRVFANIARLWNAWLANHFVNPPTICPADVAELMGLLKYGRMGEGEFSLDDYVDAIGYAALAGELAQPRETRR